jgi:hypothetical protein
MASDLISATISLSFKANSYLPKTPLQYDNKTKRFIFKGSEGFRPFFWWYFVIFGLYIGVTNGSIAYVIYGQIYNTKPPISLSLIIPYAMAFCAGWLAAAIVLVITFSGRDIVFEVNHFFTVYETLVRIESKG